MFAQRHWTLLVFVKDQSSHWVYLNIMHEIKNLCKFELNWSLKFRDNNERKTHLLHKVVCFQMLDFEILSSKPEVSKLNSWKMTSFSKITSLQRELFLIMFYAHTQLVSAVESRHRRRSPSVSHPSCCRHQFRCQGPV